MIRTARMLLALSLAPGVVAAEPDMPQSIQCALRLDLDGNLDVGRKVRGSGLVECDDGRLVGIGAIVKLDGPKLRQGERATLLGTFAPVQEAEQVFGTFRADPPTEGQALTAGQPVGLAMVGMPGAGAGLVLRSVRLFPAAVTADQDRIASAPGTPAMSERARIIDALQRGGGVGRSYPQWMSGGRAPMQSTRAPRAGIRPKKQP